MKLLYKCLLFCALIVLCNASFAQTNAEKAKFAQQAYDEGDYYSAAAYYSDLLIPDTNNVDLIAKLADCYKKYNDYYSAETYYKQLVDKDIKLKYREAAFWLAMMQKAQGKYDLASKTFESYFEKNKKDNSYFSIRAQLEINQCLKVKQGKQDSLNVIITHLDKKINTPNSEFAPRQLSDSVLMFSSIRPNIDPQKSDLFAPIYSSRIYEAPVGLVGWNNPHIVKIEIDQKIQEGNACFNWDYTRMYFTRCQDFNRASIQCEIYYCDRNEKGWSEPKKLDKNINREGYTNTQPFFCKWDIKTDVLFFVSDRPGGQGNLDIWYAFSKDKGNTFSDPINIGTSINTCDNEITPFFDVKTKKLYFSSDGRDGFGNFDIFSSSFKDEKFKIAENIGYPVNSSYNDIYFSVNPKDSDGFFTSNRPGIFFEKSPTCCYDIFSYEWLKPKKETKKDSLTLLAKNDSTNSADTQDIHKKKVLSVTESKIKSLLPLTLYFHNDEPNPKTTQTTSTKDYEQTLIEYRKLKVKYRKEYSRGLKGDNQVKAEKDIDDFFVKYVDNGFEKLNLFCTLLLQELDSGRFVKIKVRGYCSPLASSDYNDNLAKRRINSMLLYLAAYKNGAIGRYINAKRSNGGCLVIVEEPLGEEKSNSGVSDNPNDERNSVYSRAAAMERNIKILYYESE